MIFKRFFTPKSKREPVQQDQDELIRSIRDSVDRAQRREACHRINRLSELGNLAKSDEDAGVREIALARYRKLLCGLADDSPPLSERLAELSEADDMRVIEQVAINGKESEIRLAAIQRLSSQSVLAACTLKDAVTANRNAAAERLDDKQALERVARKIGKKDKRVYRITKRKLKEIAEREALPELIRNQCHELCERLDRLGRFGKWVQDRALLELIDRQWTDIEPKADEGWKVRYLKGREKFLTAYEDYRQEHQAQIAAEEARIANRDRHIALIEELSACGSRSDEGKVRDAVAEIAARWDALEDLPEKEQDALQRRYLTASDMAAARLELLVGVRRADERLSKLLASARSDLEQSRPLAHKQVRKLMDDAKPLLKIPGIDSKTTEAFASVRERLDERLRKQVVHAEQRLEDAREKLNELTTALDAGELKQAEPLYQSLKSGLELMEASGLPRQRYADLAEEVRKLSPRLRELQKWRKWGTDQHREELCVTMEGLEEADIALEAKSLRLHDLQMRWKGLDKGGSPVSHALWNRFHAASERVYACCKPHLEQRAAAREANRRAREDICQQLEDFLDHVDWERMDWKKAVRAEREMRQAWVAEGETEGRHRRQLEKRFRTALKRLDEKLSAERTRNQQFKRDLIAKVEALVEEPNLDQAMEETKRLQREWHTTVSARQKDENRLWERLRAASDAVFGRRRQQQEAFESELTENLKTREAICEEADALGGSALEPDEILSALRKVEARWRDTEALPIPRQLVGRLAQRWRDAYARVELRHRERTAEQRQESLEVLARQAEICEQIERALEAGTLDEATIRAAEAAWQAVTPQRDARLQRGIDKRYASALEAAQEGNSALAAGLEANGKRRSELCLHLEILAQLDSPPEFTRERLAFQVNRLKDRMSEGEKDPLVGTTSDLLEEWYLCGPAPAAVASALNARYHRARAALERSEGDN